MAEQPANVLIVGPNWLGDAVMSMPALQRLRRERSGWRLTLLTRPALDELWSMHPAVAGTMTAGRTAAGTWRAARAVRAGAFDAAYIFPNSPRSALIPWLAGIRRRIGPRGRWRRALLSEAVAPVSNRAHQAWEYMAVCGFPREGVGDIEAPTLSVPEPVTRLVRDRLPRPATAAGGYAALLPGAARGPSKQWPPEHFGAIGRQLLNAGFVPLVCGGSGDVDACRAVAARIGDGAVNWGGRTALPEFAAVLSLCRVAVTNDSGGMHLAAAVGCPVVAVFGLTDPVKTGPLGTRCRVVRPDGIARGARDIARHSSAAIEALRGIAVERVWTEVSAFLAGGGA